MSRPGRKSRGRAIDGTNVRAQVSDVSLVQQRREQIVEAAVELFSRQGFYRTTVQEVAARAGMSTGSIYHYARTKEDILLLALLSVLHSYATEIPQALEGVADPMERLWRAVGAYCRVIDSRRAATVLAYRSTKSLPRKQQEMVKDAELETNRLIADCVADCRAAGLIRDVDVDMATHLFVMFAHSWALKHWRLQQSMSRTEFLSRGFDILFTGIATPAGLERFAGFRRSLEEPGDH
ncbi:MAG: TetR/AcrR family transcriptional regulator [Flavobacteriaceae bacterium]